nr:immunoglobulin light chain junction region [Macaca mulatta]MOV83157.1 immunoglobulin light chain junction region [Macaca mulatta]
CQQRNTYPYMCSF